MNDQSDDMRFLGMMMLILYVSGCVMALMDKTFFPLLFSVVFAIVFRFPYRFLWLYKAGETIES